MIERRERLNSLNIDVPRAAGADRRREPRIRSLRPVYVQPANPKGELFEEVWIMTDFSSTGIYFITNRNCYAKGTQLHVIPGVQCLRLEYVGSVVRIEKLAGGRYGIGVRLLRVRNLMIKALTATKPASPSFLQAGS